MRAAWGGRREKVVRTTGAFNWQGGLGGRHSIQLLCKDLEPGISPALPAPLRAEHAYTGATDGPSAAVPSRAFNSPLAGRHDTPHAFCVDRQRGNLLTVCKPYPMLVSLTF